MQKKNLFVFLIFHAPTSRFYSKSVSALELDLNLEMIVEILIVIERQMVSAA
jgi:hypothetical protein